MIRPQRRGVLAALAVVLIALLFWTILSIEAVHQQAAYYTWLRAGGTHARVTVSELGELRADGTARQVWVTTPRAQGCPAGPLSIDLSYGDEAVTRVGQSFEAVYSCSDAGPLENPPDGVSAGAVDHHFGPEYARRVALPVTLVLLDIGGLVVIGRRPRVQG